MTENVAIEESITIPPTWLQSFWNRNSALLKLAGMMGILLFAFWVGMDPHWDYKYPLHVDEWFAMGYTDAMMEEGSLEYPNPYYSGQTINRHVAFGFHLLLGSLTSATNITWMSLYRLAPALLLTLMAFFIYALGRRDRFGWAAALFVVLVPTSIRTLGPAFLVPVATAMLFIPVTLLLLYRLKDSGESFLLLLILIGATLIIHPPTESAVTVLVLLYLLALFGETLALRQYKTATKILIAMGIRMLLPLIVLAYWIPSLTKSTFESSMTSDVTYFSLINHYGPVDGFVEAFGVIGIVLTCFGLFVFTWKRPYGIRTYVIPVYIGTLLLFLTIIYPEYVLGPGVVYERGWSYLGVLMAILAGYGVHYWFVSVGSIKRMSKPEGLRHLTGPVRVIALVVGISTVIAALVNGLWSDERDVYANYYHLMDDNMYHDFVWIGQNVQTGSNEIMMEPSLAWAYPPIAGSGKTVVEAAAAPWFSEWADRTEEALVTGEVEVEWLKDEGAKVFYTRLPQSKKIVEIDRPGLLLVRPGVYLVAE